MASKDKKPAKPSGTRPGIRTLSDLNRSSGSGSDSDSDGPQEYYTGGEKRPDVYVSQIRCMGNYNSTSLDLSQRFKSRMRVEYIDSLDHAFIFLNGMLVQDPSKGNQDVDAIFDRARQLGALEGPVDPLRASSSSRSFTGTGRLLSGETVPSAPQQPEAVVHNIVFWSNGFTVNDGPLRRLDDPENAPFLESIRKSECPKELEPADRRSSVHVNLVRREENCPEVEKRQVSFQGVGRTLGSGSTPSGAATEPSTVASAKSIPLSSSAGLSLDPSLPSTSIQLRLSDGTRMIARLNHHHTIGDIRAFIDASRPGGTRDYQLQAMGFPPKQLNDLTQTIEQAGLANSVVIQKS